MLSEEGRVEQIYWNQLPALTDDQLRRVEAAIRLRSYPHGIAGNLVARKVTEIIDVRGMLNLPAVQRSDTVSATSGVQSQ